MKKSAETRKALRFFAERRVKVHFVDLAERAASLGELRRFAQKFGVEALLDRTGRRFADLGLRAARTPTIAGWKSWRRSPGCFGFPWCASSTSSRSGWPSDLETLDGAAKMPQIALSGVAVDFGATTLLETVSFTVERGDAGASSAATGSGKTTLFHLITGAMRRPGAR